MGSHSSRRAGAVPATKADPEFAKRRQAARKQAREDAGLSLEELATKLNRPPAMIERLERTGNVPEFLAGQWSELLGCKKELFL